MTFVLGYLLVTAVFAVPTLVEGHRRSLGWGADRLAGLAMSLAWPVIAAMIIMAGNREHSRR